MPERFSHSLLSTLCTILFIYILASPKSRAIIHYSVATAWQSSCFSSAVASATTAIATAAAVAPSVAVARKVTVLLATVLLHTILLCVTAAEICTSNNVSHNRGIYQSGNSPSIQYDGALRAAARGSAFRKIKSYFSFNQLE